MNEMPDFIEQAVSECKEGSLTWLIGAMGFPTVPAEVHAYGTVIGTGTVSNKDPDGGPGKPEKKPAVTEFERLATAELPMPSAEHPTSRYALLRCTPVTGRFRQIRRHLKHVSHHLIGDTSHGDGRHNRAFRMLGVHRMLLHAARLRFAHPVSGELVDVRAPLDAAFAKALDRLGIAPPA